MDPDGNSPTIFSGVIGGFFGGAIGGGFEVASQLINNGEVSDWKAVGGAAAQGAITGAAAGLTCGASLLVTAGASAVSNAVGGVVNREIQGKETTATDVVTDATVGGMAASIGCAAGQLTKNGLDAATPATKGKIGEATTQVRYALRGYFSDGNAIVKTGKNTPTGQEHKAIYDFTMKNAFTGKTIIVESKFNGARLTTNQKAALPNVKVPFVVDRTTSTQFQNGVQSTVTFGIQLGTYRFKND